jgi:hypothetical protein
MQSSLGRAVDNMADDFVKAGKDVSRDVSNVVYNPIVSGITHHVHILCDCNWPHPQCPPSFFFFWGGGGGWGGDWGPG